MQRNFDKTFEWTQKYSTKESCLEDLNRYRWKKGFICSKFGHDKSCQLKYRYLHERVKCGRQVSPTVGTVFKNRSLQPHKWFVATYLVSADKGKILVQRLSKMISFSWPIVNQMLGILRHSIGGRDRGYCLEGLVERVNSEQFREFSWLISSNSEIRTKAFNATLVLGESHRCEPKTISPEKVNEWLSNACIVISNFKSILVKTFHRVSFRYSRKYIDKFVFRFENRFRLLIRFRCI